MPLTEIQLEASLIAQEQATAAHTIRVMKALIDNRLSIHEVDFDALTAKVNAVNTLLDGDENTEGFQVFAALSTKLNTVEATANNNAASITNLQNALNSQIATLTGRVDQVEADGLTARTALDARITTLNDQYTTHVAAQLLKDNGQDTRLDDHQARIEALESAKILHDTRLADLETDNVVNKSAIAQLQTTTAAQTAALIAAQAASETESAAIRAELVTERSRIDALANASGHYATRQNVADASEAGASAYVAKLWADAGISMSTGLAMPDGSVSA